MQGRHVFSYSLSLSLSCSIRTLQSPSCKLQTHEAQTIPRRAASCERDRKKGEGDKLRWKLVRWQMSPNNNTWYTAKIYSERVFLQTLRMGIQEIENRQQQNRKGGYSWLTKWATKKALVCPRTFHNWVVFHPLKTLNNQGFFHCSNRNNQSIGKPILGMDNNRSPCPKALQKARLLQKLQKKTRQQRRWGKNPIPTCSLVELGCLWRAQAFRICWDSTWCQLLRLAWSDSLVDCWGFWRSSSKAARTGRSRPNRHSVDLWPSRWIWIQQGYFWHDLVSLFHLTKYQNCNTNTAHSWDISVISVLSYLDLI